MLDRAPGSWYASTTRTIQIVTGAEKNMLTQKECERACKAQPGATACQWDNNDVQGELGDLRGEYLGRCRYFTDSDATDIRDCEYAWWNTDDFDPEAEPCYNYEGTSEFCMVFRAKVVQKGSKKCKGKDFKDRYNPDNGKFKGIRVFNCGKNKTKKECKLGCKRGYTLKKDEVIGAPPSKAPAGTPHLASGGTESRFTAHCINGKVIHGMLPICVKK
jgi:hypothetical protein